MKRVLIVLLCAFIMMFTVYAQTELHSGGQAIVNVLDPTGLRMRTGAGTANDLTESLFTGDVVDILDGPQTVDGLIWWQIRAPSGNVGWSVEAAGGVRTLIPISWIVTASDESTLLPTLTLRLSEDVYNLVWSPNSFVLAVGFTSGNVAFHSPELHRYAIEETGQPDAYIPILRNDVLPANIRFSTDPYPFAEITGPLDPTNPESPVRSVVYDYLIYDVGGFINDSPIPEDNLPTDIEWIEPTPQLVVSACAEAQPAVIQHPQGTLHVGNPAQFISIEGTVMELGDGSGGIAWNADSNHVLIWSRIAVLGSETDQPLPQGTAEIWDIETGTRLLSVPHASDYTSTCGSEARPAALSMDGRQLATTIATGDDTLLLFWDFIAEGE